jgi:hypothetical protein
MITSAFALISLPFLGKFIDLTSLQTGVLVLAAGSFVFGGGLLMFKFSSKKVG